MPTKKSNKINIGGNTVFGRTISIEMLHRGFERVLKNNGAAGGDGVSPSVYVIGLEMRIANLHKRLAERRYEPGPVEVFEIPKPGKSEKRVLRVPCVADRVVQSSATIVLQDILEPEFESFSYAYRPKRSVRMALDSVLKAHREGYEWVVDADLKSFFDEVPHVGLLGALAVYVPERPFIDLTRQWLNLSAFPGRGLPQGAPVSPILANLYLDSLDEHMDDAGFRMVRYADDFVLLCKSRREAERAVAHAGGKLAELGLAFHPEKTAIRRLDEGYSFLGENIRKNSLFEQSLELADLPGAIEAEDEAGIFDGGLLVAASRRIMEREIDPTGKIPINARQALDAPWDTAVDGEVVEGVADIDEPPARSRHAPFVRPLYLMEKGRLLEAHQRGFALLEDGLVVALIAPGTIDKVEIYPGVDISTAAMRLAAAQGVPVFFVNGRGATQSVLTPEIWSRSRLHAAQARHGSDTMAGVALARAFVAGRIYNARRLLQRLRLRLNSEERKTQAGLEDAIRRMDYGWRHAERHPEVGTVAAAMAIEAEAARFYWPALAALLKRGFAEQKFTRSRQPANTPFNALLNFTAWLLARDVETLLLKRGLHTGLSALHSIDDHRSGLVFDLMEEFRAPIAEAASVLALSTGVLDADDFVDVEFDGGSDVVILPEAQQKLIRLYERHVDNLVKLPGGGGKTTWRGMIDHQISRYVDYVSGGNSYISYRMDV